MQSAFAKMYSEYRKMHTNERPIIISGDVAGMFEDVLSLGGTGANSLNASITRIPNMSVDFAIDTVIQGLAADNLSHALTWLPGSVRLLEWYRYDDPIYEELNKEDYALTTMMIDGYKFDYTVKYDECAEAWTWELSKQS